MRLKVLDLFSGIGGFSLGLERTGGFSTVAFCEIEEFPRRVLAKHWPEVPIHTDVRKLRAEDVGPVDVICGGYPCQPFSTAGQRRGAEDDRHLWPEFARLIAEIRPRYVIGENVAGHVSMGLDCVLTDLEALGYTARPFIIPACATNVPHRRDRVWIVAHRDYQPQQAMRGKCADIAREGFSGRALRGGGNSDAQRQVAHGGAGEDTRHVADANRAGLQGRAQAGDAGGIGARGDEQPQRRADSAGTARRFEPSMGRVADGFSPRLDEPGDRVTTNRKDRAARLKALGNAVVPAIPEMIGRAILEAERAE